MSAATVTPARAEHASDRREQEAHVAAIHPPPAPLLDELNDVDQRVREHLSELLTVFEREGPGYARRYAKWAMTSASMHGPTRPAAMHPEVARAIRDIVMDELHVRRRVPVRLR